MLIEALVAAFAALAYASPPHILGGLLQARSSISSGCATEGPVSCHNTTIVTNLCCFEAPGGLLILSEFWDTNPPTGPANSWTINGLWPDTCDDTSLENCDPSRQYSDISGLLTSQGASSTLDFMQTYWVDIHGNNEAFWEHEWSTYGTCYSTLEPSCLPSGSVKGAEAVAYFQTVAKLFPTCDIYKTLANAGITPSTSQTYTLSALQSAIQSGCQVTPAFQCSSGNLIGADLYFNLQGSLIDGTFVPVDAPTPGKSCPSAGISYPPKA